MIETRRHEIDVTPRGVVAYVKWAPIRRALVFHVAIDGRWFSFEVRLGDLLIDLRIREGMVVGCLRRALSLRPVVDRAEMAEADQDAA